MIGRPHTIRLITVISSSAPHHSPSKDTSYVDVATALCSLHNFKGLLPSYQTMANKFIWELSLWLLCVERKVKNHIGCLVIILVSRAGDMGVVGTTGGGTSWCHIKINPGEQPTSLASAWMLQPKTPTCKDETLKNVNDCKDRRLSIFPGHALSPTSLWCSSLFQVDHYLTVTKIYAAIKTFTSGLVKRIPA